MTWVTPSTAPSDGRIGYTAWVDQVVNNVNELYHRKADTMSSVLVPASTGSAAKNTPLYREMRAVELGGQEDWTSLDTVEANTYHPFGGGPGDAFTIPKGMSGLWRFAPVAGGALTQPGTVQTMWSFNSSQTSTGFPAASTDETAWTYQWCVASAAVFGGLQTVEPGGVVIERFSSGDQIRFYSLVRFPSGSTVACTLNASGVWARVWAQFLGTTV